MERMLSYNWLNWVEICRKRLHMAVLRKISLMSQTNKILNMGQSSTTTPPLLGVVTSFSWHKIG